MPCGRYIGAWDTVLYVLSILAVIANTFLVGFVSTASAWFISCILRIVLSPTHLPTTSNMVFWARRALF